MQKPFTHANSVFLYFAFSSATVYIAILIPTYTNTNKVNPTAKFLVAPYHTATVCDNIPVTFLV